MAQILASGLAMGCIYALVGLSFVLIYNATHGLNFAHGELVMLGAFILFSLLRTGIPYWLAVVGTLLVMAVVGFFYQLLLFYPLRNRPSISFVIATIGIGVAMRNGALLIWGPNPLKVPSFFLGNMRFAGLAMAPEHLFIIAATVVVLALQYLLFFHTDIGRRLRATAQNAEMAQLLGIRVERMVAVTFVMASALAGVAAILVAPIFLVDIDLGVGLILKAFVAVIVGGFGSIPGAVVGGLLVGVLEILVAVHVSSVYRDAITFLVLILFLLARPQGLFGEKVSERA
jgi:branched-chain amino acid transport system permease protein